jgi:hypothetical protein
MFATLLCVENVKRVLLADQYYRKFVESEH